MSAPHRVAASKRRRAPGARRRWFLWHWLLAPVVLLAAANAAAETRLTSRPVPHSQIFVSPDAARVGLVPADRLGARCCSRLRYYDCALRAEESLHAKHT